MIPLKECIRIQNHAGPPSQTTRGIMVNISHIVTMTEYLDKLHPEANSCITISVGDNKKTIFVVESLEQINRSINSRELLNG